MNHETNELLRQLAEKLGTTTEYLWKILVNHAHLSATFSLINSILLLLVPLFTWWYYKKFNSRFQEDDRLLGKEMTFYAVLFIILIVMSFISILMIGQSVRNVLYGYFDPQYWALEEILDAVKK